MNRILLRINHLNIEDSVYGKLNYFSLSLCSRQILGLEGLNRSGKMAIIQALKGNLEAKWACAAVYFKNLKIDHPVELEKKISFLDFDLPLDLDWSVYEFLQLGNTSFFLNKKCRNEMINKAREDCLAFSFSIDVRKKMRDLTAMEDRAVRFMKAARDPKEIIVIEDAGYGLTGSDLETYRGLLNKTAQTGKGILLSFHKNDVIRHVCNEYLILRRGRVVKKCTKISLNQESEQDFVLGNTLRQKMDSMEKDEDYRLNRCASSNNLYDVKLWANSGREKVFSFTGGQIHAYIIEGTQSSDDFFEVLCGRRTRKDVAYQLNGVPIHGRNMRDFIQKKIVSIKISELDHEIFGKMTVRDNLMIPLDGGISALTYFRFGKSMGDVLCSEIPYGSFVASRCIGREDVNRQMIILMNRWLVFRPKVLVVGHPFKNCDTYGVYLMKAFLKRFTEIGTAVILVSSDPEYCESVADWIDFIDDFDKRGFISAFGGKEFSC